MNCQELKEDIEQLEKIYSKAEEKFTQIDDSVKKSEINHIQTELTSKTDEILEKYLDDFFEQYPEYLQVRLINRIDGFLDKNNEKVNITFIYPLSNGNALVGGDNGTLFECQAQPNQPLKLSNRIMHNYVNTNLSSITALSDEDIIIGGRNGLCYRCQKQPGQPFQLANTIPTPLRGITAISALPNNEILIGGDYGKLYRGKEQPDKSYEFDQIEQFPDTITVISPLSNNDALVGGFRFLYECQRQNDGSYRASLSITDYFHNTNVISIHNLPNNKILVKDSFMLREFQKTNGTFKLTGRTIPGIGFKTVSLLPNNKYLIGSINGEMREFQKKRDGSFTPTTNPLILYKEDNKPATIKTAATLSNGHILVGGNSSALFELQCPKKSLNTLKQAIADNAQFSHS